jgi:hypothetical protein
MPDVTSGEIPHREPSTERNGRAIAPTTRLGRWAVGLAAASVVLNFGWRLMGPLGAFPALVFGLAGGIVGLTAILGRHERAASVFVALLPFAGVVLFLLGEFLVGHE